MVRKANKTTIVYLSIYTTTRKQNLQNTPRFRRNINMLPLSDTPLLLRPTPPDPPLLYISCLLCLNSRMQNVLTSKHESLVQSCILFPQTTLIFPILNQGNYMCTTYLRGEEVKHCCYPFVVMKPKRESSIPDESLCGVVVALKWTTKVKCRILHPVCVGCIGWVPSIFMAELKLLNNVT